MSVTIERYRDEFKAEWDAFVKNAKNATFILERDYMDYHSDRFTDCSLMFYKKESLIAVLPANIDKKQNTLQSHGGLTYGGLIMHNDTKCSDVIDIFASMADYMRDTLNVDKLHYKAVPYIYCSRPSDEPLYALFRMRATLLSRTVSTTIETACSNKMGQQRKRGVKKAAKAGISCCESNDFGTFWGILEETLSSCHGCRPVHTVQEIEMLHQLFPDNIRLFTAMESSRILAGTVVYESKNVAHLQYIAASPDGKRCGALDALIMHLIDNIYNDKRYIDFGISTEQGGRVLNQGLIQQKEGFGGSAVVYDTYEIQVAGK